MLEEFLEVIRNAGIFIICAQAIMHFRPKASYEKYLKVLVSIIVLIILLVPCFQVLGGAEEFLYSMDQYEDFLRGNKKMEWEMYDNTENTDEDNVGEFKETPGEIEVKSGLNNSVETIVIEPVEVIE